MCIRLASAHASAIALFHLIDVVEVVPGHIVGLHQPGLCWNRVSVYSFSRCVTSFSYPSQDFSFSSDHNLGVPFEEEGQARISEKEMRICRDFRGVVMQYS